MVVFFSLHERSLLWCRPQRRMNRRAECGGGQVENWAMQISRDVRGFYSWWKHRKAPIGSVALLKQGLTVPI
jgi:hypothetical protein